MNTKCRLLCLREMFIKYTDQNNYVSMERIQNYLTSCGYPAYKVTIKDDIDALIFLREPMNPKPHEPEVNDLFRLCDTYNIPMATNLATAELIILAIDRGDLDWREMYR